MTERSTTRQSTLPTRRTPTVPSSRRLPRLAALLVAASLVAGCGAGEASGAGGAADAAPSDAIRVSLASALPANAPGQQLYLEEVTISPGVTLPKHIHEGTQIANIRNGTLIYVIESGTADVTRADGTEEQFTGPLTIELNAGDSIVEREDLVHYSQNPGDEPIVIILAVLLREGAPFSTPVE
jgi:quercetin dioxygenase-like cupin family protein